MSAGAPASNSSDMGQQPTSDSDHYSHYTLCEFTGGENYKFQEILNFVLDHFHEVHMDGLCAQVQKSLETEFQMTLSHAEIKNHFLHHQFDQKIVLNNILRYLVPLVGVARSNCWVLTQENTTIVDPKTMGMYLGTVKQVMGIYKHLDA